MLKQVQHDSFTFYFRAKRTIKYKGVALRSSRLFPSQQKKEALRLPFKFGREETRTLTPKALDPKSSASTNFATRPKACVCEHLLIYQDQNYLSKGIFKYKFYKYKVL